jgi:glycosyltransferase involved in cell wall biosynthesis
VVSNKVAFAVPGDLATPTGGFAYDRRIIGEFVQLGLAVQVLDLGDGFPYPSAVVRSAAQSCLAAVEARCPIVIDGLAFGVLPDVAAELSLTHPLIALVHHPLALESGLSSATAQAFRVSEREALSHVRHVIVTSEATARLVCAEYAVPADRLTVAPPGTDRVAKATGSNDGIVSLIAVGAVVPRKAYDVLVSALARIVDMPWRLAIVGDLTRDPAAAAALKADIVRHGLASKVTLTGSVSLSELEQRYASADLFVLASRFEGYGMAYAEAIAHGLPVIGTTAGAIPDTVPADAAILVRPDDIDMLTKALHDLISDRTKRQMLAEAAWREAQALPSWRQSAELFLKAIKAAS